MGDVIVPMLPPQIDLPSRIPVMLLPACNLLPHGLLPLYIFEPRYRQMLADSLESDRLFAIGTIDPNAPLSDGEPDVFDYSCAGLIRACVGADDGSAHLILQELQRIRFTAWDIEEKPYRLAEIEAVTSIDTNFAESVALATRALELARELITSGRHPNPPAKAFEEIEALDDPEPLADMLAYHLIRSPHQRQALLGMQDIGERLQFIIEQLANPGPSLP